MGTHTVYRLTFKTQLHLGRASGPAQQGNLGLEKTETYVSADTLFSAICQTWALFYGAEDLTDFLNCYIGDSTALPFTLTSAFPFAYDVYFFPKPLTCRGSEDLAEKTKKKIKRVQFVSRSVFQDITAGNLLEFKAAPLINGEKVWVTPEERKGLERSIDAESTIWKTDTRPRVRVGSQTAESDIWHIETVQFNTGCGLWFAVHFDSDETQQKIETLLRVLGDTGIGGEKNAGYGLFDFTPATIEIPSAEAGNQFVTLSPICPKSPGQLKQFLTGDVAYTLNSLTGWVSTSGTRSRRKQISMFAEGSVLHVSDEPIGRLVDLKPDAWPHPVYRYGYAWPVGIKGTSE